ncbi:MAG: hypothetical protein V4456_16835 [Bacteroidota bacterium]
MNLRKTLTLLLAIIWIFPALAQTKTGDLSIYLQVTALLENSHGDTVKVNADILNALSNLLGTDSAAAAQKLQSNPFLKDKVIITGAKSYLVHGSGAFTIASPGLLLGLDVTNFANGLATLMIDRAKQELTLAFFNRLQTFSKKYPEFQVLFPKTYDYLRNLLTNAYPQMLPALRNSFYEDLQQVTYNLEAVLELKRYQELMDRFPEISMAIQTLKLIHKLEKGTDPAQLIADIDTELEKIEGRGSFKNASSTFKNTIAGVHFAAIFSASLRDNDTRHVWINLTQAENILTNELSTRVYMALLYEAVKVKKIDFYLNGKPKSLAKLMEQQKDQILLFQTKLKQFIDQAGKIQTSFDVLKPPGSRTSENYIAFMRNSLEGIDFAFSIVKLFDDRLQPDDYMDIIRKSAGMYRAIYEKQYTKAINDGLDVISSIAVMTNYDKRKVAANDPAKDAYELASKQLNDFITKVRPFALFIANIVEAKDEQDITAALNNAVLPVGSSSIKKNTIHNLTIQSYLGAYFSTYNQRPDAIRSWSDKVGIYGPVGLAYTPGIFSWKKLGSLSIFASVFDLGAIIDYKLKEEPSTTTSTNSGTNSLQNKSYSVNLGQIFSPGAHLVYGFFGNLPLAVGAGFQYGPGLTKIDAAGTTNVINPCWRFNMFLTVDLPLFNIFNKSASK